MEFHTKRRSPRIPAQSPARLLVRRKNTATQELLYANVHDIGAEGIGLGLVDDGSKLERGSSVTVEITLNQLPTRLPGKIVWSTAARAGVKLNLAVAVTHEREAYLKWLARRAHQSNNVGELVRSIKKS